MGNPLVAEREDSTKSFSGVQILESVDETKKAIEQGDWAAGVLGATGTALDALGMAMDPFGSILAAGVGWLMEHVGPVSDALDALTGDPDEIKSHSETWKNISGELAAISTDMTDMVKADTAGWTGKAGDAYRKRSEDTATLLEAAKSAADGASSGIGTAGEVVAAVRTLVRDIIAELVGHLVSWALQVIATLGIGLTWVVPQVIAEVTKVATKIADITMKLVKAMKALTPMLKKLGKGFGEATDSLKKIKADGSSGPPPKSPPPGSGSRGGPAGTNSANADKSPDGGPPPGRNDGPADTNSTNADGSSPPKADPPPPGKSGNDGPADGPGSHTRGGPNGTNPGGNRSPNKTDPPGRNQPPLKDQQPNPRPEGKCTTKGDPIDVSTGRMLLTQTDAELDGVLPLLLQRTHVSNYRMGRAFGPSWMSTLDQRLEVHDEGVSFAAADGTLQHYPHPAPGSSVLSEQGARRPLHRTVDGGYLIGDFENDRILRFEPGVSVLPLASMTNRNGHRIEFDYDESGAPLEVRHSGGHQVRVESADGLVTALVLVGADNGRDLNLMSYRYTGNRLTEVVNASGVPLRFDYDDAGRIIGWTDRNGAWYRFTYDHEGRCVRGVGGEGFLNGTMEYDSANRITHYTNSLDQRTTFHMNEAGQVIREVDPLGNVTTSEWDAYDNLLSRTDALGRTVRYEYDEAGNRTAVTRPDGSRAQIEHDDMGNPITLIAPDGSVSRREYDERGNVTKVIDPAGAVTTYSYDERGSLTATTDPLGNTSRVDNDASGLPVGVTDARGAVTRYERDGFGRVVAIFDPEGGVDRFGWTVDGRLAWRRQPDGTVQRWVHDGEGNARSHVDQLARTTTAEVIQFDRVSAETRPDGTRVGFEYDTEVRLARVTNQQGLVWHYEYDPVGNLVRETDFNGRSVSYRYDAARRLVERTNGAGETTRFVYDSLDNVIERHTGSEVSTFVYDALGRTVEAANGDAKVSFQRDALGRIVAETTNGRTIASGYDVRGRRTHRRTPSGAESVWEYDHNDNPVTLRTAGRTMRFGYDSLGREVQRSLDSGLTLAQAWTPKNRLLSQTITGAAGQQVQQRSYSYQEDGVLAAVHDRLTGPRTFGLDQVGRVTAVQGSGWTEQYAYDAAGNVAQAAWATPSTSENQEAPGDREYAGNLLRRAGNFHYNYDAQGRIVLRQRKRLSHQPDTWRYSWNAEDRLVGVVTPDGSRWRYRYDPFGRRIAKQRLTPDGRNVIEQVDFVWDGLVLAERAQVGEPGRGGARVTVWNHEPDGYRPLLQSERFPLRDAPQQWVDEQFYVIVTDLAGSPTELVTDDGGIAWFHRHTLWGSTLDQSRTGAETPLRFPGQYYDRETGLHYNFFRYYDPATGRYASADPLGLEAGPNNYAYVANPHLLTDPLGLMTCDELNAKNKEKMKEGKWDFIGHHGTGKQNSESILTGINPPNSGSNAGANLGDGFYVTPNKNTANEFGEISAHGPAPELPDPPAPSDFKKHDAAMEKYNDKLAEGKKHDVFDIYAKRDSDGNKLDIVEADPKRMQEDLAYKDKMTNDHDGLTDKNEKGSGLGETKVNPKAYDRLTAVFNEDPT